MQFGLLVRGPTIPSVAAALAVSLLGLALTLPATAFAGDPLDELAHLIESTAAIQAMVGACAEESPTVSQHLLDAADAWWERNVRVRETMRGLAFNEDPSSTQFVLDLFERLKAQMLADLKVDAEQDPPGFALRCADFIHELASGDLDYRPQAR